MTERAQLVALLVPPHVASALSIRADLSTFVAYDHCLCEAVSAAGLELLTPGRDDLGPPTRHLTLACHESG